MIIKPYTFNDGELHLYFGFAKNVFNLKLLSTLKSYFFGFACFKHFPNFEHLLTRRPLY